ncbi:uroporphyrinogen-III synthase [Bacillus sp. V59.32b]|uniref:uroporphyrinogen-III synthase n=1 Tax=Bacillus sp. V59.32b TaxID=1758642 RepID=UPI000E3E5F3F|nr:uroporphyrinogen-III synthase [Bacillus sp. V59.32b]RFU62571.1 uroporphyrinogen-III synthase [Bacillus sp. V59.32b]
MLKGKPLKGYNVLVTRGKEQAADLLEKVAANGGIPHAIPLIDFVPVSGEIEHLTRLDDYDWLVFTSQNGVEFFFRLLEQMTKPACMPKMAVIGNKTKEALERFGFLPDFMPDEYVAEVFAAQFLEHLDQNDKVLIAKGNLARSVICDEISRFGAVCEEIIVYETIFPAASERLLIELLQTGTMDIVTFTSSSTVHHFIEAVKKHGMQKEIEKLIIACIGPVAKKTAENRGLVVDACPENEYTGNAMIESLIQYLQDKNDKEEKNE